MIRLLVGMAVASGGALLMADLFARNALPHFHASLSALPLVLIGTTYALAQLGWHPRGRELVQAILVISAFLGWGLDQLLPAGPPATMLGDLVIVLYVVDLSMVIQARLPPPPTSPPDLSADTACLPTTKPRLRVPAHANTVVSAPTTTKALASQQVSPSSSRVHRRHWERL